MPYSVNGFPADAVEVLVPANQPKDGNLVARLEGRERGLDPILLLAHIDVVEAKRADWERDPFKLVEENGDKIEAELKAEIEAALAEAKTAIESGDAEAMTAKSQALTELAMKMGQAIYEKEQAAAASPGADAGPSESGGEDVVDAEFSEVDDSKG